MNWKLIIGGGIVYYVAQFVVGMISGPLLHEGILDAVYRQHEAFWRPELNQDPPDMAALMPRWISIGLLISFVTAGVYGWLRAAFAGPGWQKGLKFGVLLWIISATTMAGWSGVFNLPDSLWAWWTAEYLVYYLVGGAALGWFADKFAPA